MFYSILNNDLLLFEVNYHPVFSYGLSVNIHFTKNKEYTVYVHTEKALQLVSEYHNNVKLIKELKTDKDEIELPLNKPLIDEDYFNQQSLKKQYSFEVNDQFDLTSAESLIKSDYCCVKPVKKNPSYTILRKPNKGKPKLLITAPYAFFVNELNTHLEENYDIIYCYQAPKSILKELLKDREIIFTSTCPPYLVNADLFEFANNLKIIATPSTGTTHINVSEVSKLGVKIITIKESKVIERIYASSEFSFTLLLAMVNKLNIVIEAAKNGVWREQETYFRSNELHSKTIGLLGYGRIGKKMSRFCNSMGINVIAYDPNVTISDGWVKQMNSKDEILENSDIVSVHYHYLPEEGITFTKADFLKMKAGSFFLNTARGEIVDELAMIECLTNKHLKAAAVDVITEEYKYDNRNHPIINYAKYNDNLIVAPHVAGLTVESESKAAIDIFKQLSAHLKNEK